MILIESVCLNSWFSANPLVRRPIAAFFFFDLIFAYHIAAMMQTKAKTPTIMPAMAPFAKCLFLGAYFAA